MQQAFALLIGYAFGCFLTADIVARAYTGKSIFEIGTGNPGMANTMAQIGKKAGFTVLAGDIIKTLLAFLITWLILGRAVNESTQFNLIGQPVLTDWILWCGLGAVLGHNWPIWHKFKGGKGVTVTCTWLIIAMPIWGIISCVAGGVLTLITGFLPLGAIIIGGLGAIAAYITLGCEAGIFFLIGALIMLSRHYKGIGKMMKGTEKKHFHKK